MRDSLAARSRIIHQVRQFFADRNVLEVETPVLSHYGVTDVYLDSLSVHSEIDGGPIGYLQTSPEYGMKRLLANDSGCIYQITKAFRDEIATPLHRREFTMLEWYRLDFDHHALMDEMDALLQILLGTASAERLTYQQLFQRYLGLCPFSSDIADFECCAKQNGLSVASSMNGRDDWLFLLMSHCIEPKLTQLTPTFVYDFPVSQASLARLNAAGDRAHRFEVYVKGVELANGFWELTDACEQQARFEHDNTQRVAMGKPIMQIDEAFIQALKKGLPNCAGVALGIDRLLMLVLDKVDIADVHPEGLTHI